MTLLSLSSRSSVDRVPAPCSGSHGFDSCRGLRIFLCPTLVSPWLIHFHISLPSLKFTIFIDLSINTPLYLGQQLSGKQDHSAFCVPLTDLAAKYPLHWYDLPVLLNFPSLSAAIQVPFYRWHLRQKHVMHLPFQLNTIDQQLKIAVIALEVFGLLLKLNLDKTKDLFTQKFVKMSTMTNKVEKSTKINI